MTTLSFTPAAALLGGLTLGIAAVGKLALTGRIMGISGIVRCASHHLQQLRMEAAAWPCMGMQQQLRTTSTHSLQHLALQGFREWRLPCLARRMRCWAAGGWPGGWPGRARCL
jgi:hypothetical protein